MPTRLVNTRSDRVVEYALPEEIAPPERTYPTKDAKAIAEREAGRRKRLLDTLNKSRRWKRTDRPVERVTARQRDEARREAERRRIEAEVRAEFEQRLETERAKARLASGGSATGAVASSEPSTAEVRAWAREHGYEVPARGKLPDDVVAAYKAAHEGGE
ncbi:Lsr2 family DNA-binding protein [Nocardiopsis lucentensis]|uniref:Lsr2 family DNA-binding protein n=1 Tax=Nocardiopsis lucentensis TaxID=53441 RepID=UPI00034AFF11|nr:histone-like nucleoid-structuring protein Lsr2 [Nocardiopsis lucentensis]